MLLFTASGTGAFESAVANLVSPGEPHLVVSAGDFGERWADDDRQLRRRRRPPALRVGRDARPRRRARAAARARGEGGLGRPLRDVDRRRRDIQALAAVAKEAGALVVVDAVSSLGAVPLRDRRVGPRRRRLRLAEGADDAARARPVRRSRRLRSPPPASSPRFYFDWERTRKAQAKLDARVHAARLARRRARRRARAAARGRPRGRARPAHPPRPRLPRRREGDGPRALLARRGPQRRRHRRPRARRDRAPTTSSRACATASG